MPPKYFSIIKFGLSKCNDGGHPLIVRKVNLKILREMQNIFSASELLSSCVENRTLLNTQVQRNIKSPRIWNAYSHSSPISLSIGEINIWFEIKGLLVF